MVTKTVDTPRPPSPPVPKDAISIPVPLTDERMATVTIPVGMTEQDWQRFERILSGYKPEPPKNENTPSPQA